jgi:hypothetical protein
MVANASHTACIAAAVPAAGGWWGLVLSMALSLTGLGMVSRSMRPPRNRG